MDQSAAAVAHLRDALLALLSRVGGSGNSENRTIFEDVEKTTEFRLQIEGTSGRPVVITRWVAENNPAEVRIQIGQYIVGEWDIDWDPIVEVYALPKGEKLGQVRWELSFVWSFHSGQIEDNDAIVGVLESFAERLRDFEVYTFRLSSKL